MGRKITRIILRSAGYLTLVLLVLLTVLYFAVQTYTFQTWLGNKAGSYLSSELNTTVRIKTVRLDFFSKAVLEGVFISDLHKDTLFYGNLEADIRNFDLQSQSVHLERIALKNSTAKVIRYNNESDFNFQFVADYFDSGKKDSTAQGWDVTFNKVELDNVAFVYRKEKFVTPVTNNINFDDIWLRHTYGSISGLKIKGDTITADIYGLRTVEQTGFRLLSLTANARISNSNLLCENISLKTPGSFIKGKVDFSYTSWDDYQDFIHRVRMNSELWDSTTVSFKDIAAFAPELNGLDKKAIISGKVKGTVDDMNLQNLAFSFGRYTTFRGNVRMTGLPDINTTFIHFDAKELSTNYQDIVSLPDYPFTENRKIKVPAEITRLGTVRYRGKFDGFINDFTTYGKFSTGLGQVNTDLSVRLAEKEENVAFHGKVVASGFDLGTMLGLTEFNNLSMDCEVKGKGASLKTLDAEFIGEVANLSYNGYDYRNVKLNGTISNKLFNGLLICKDPNADFDFNGTVNFHEKVPQMDFISTINHLNLKSLHFTNKSDSGILSSQILINVKGDNLDNLSGVINFDNTIYKTKTRTFKLSTFNIQAEQGLEEKKIRLTSEYLNAAAYGDFELTSIYPAFQSLLYYYYPTFFKKPTSTRKYDDELNFSVRIKKFNTINELFLPDLMVSPATQIEGRFNAGENKLNAQVNSSRIRYKNMTVNDIVLILNENNNTVLAEASGKSFYMGDSLHVDNFNVAVTSIDKESKYSVDWDNLKSPSNKGEIKGSVRFEQSAFHIVNEKIELTFRDSTWKLGEPGNLRIDNHNNFFVEHLMLTHGEQAVGIEGALTAEKTDSLLINTNHVVLRQFNPLLSLFNLKLEGIMDGHISLSNASRNFAFVGDLRMTDLKINDNTIGELSVRSAYNTGQKFIALNGFTSLGVKDENGEPAKNISFNGNYYLEKKEDAIDISFATRPANLSLLNPLLKDILTIKNGFVNGEGRISGTPDNIKIDGKFRLFNSEIKVDYTNVTYNITGDIEIMPDQIRFSDLLLREKGTKSAPQGTINGNIFHQNFNKIRLDYDVSYRNMLVLNTTERENETFYGKVYGTGNVGIYGFLNNLNMEIGVTTNRNSRFYLPMDGPASIGESDFIYFIKKDTVEEKKEKALSGFNLVMNVHATPEAQAQIIFDRKTGDVLNVRGQGDLNLTVNTFGKFEMFGDYIITDGDYLFTLENVINKKFDIEAGSSISWSGNPVNADIDVTASYRQRASVAPLLNDTVEFTGRTPVDCRLLITGKLSAVNIGFDFDFPNLDATAKSRIESVLTDESELNTQVFSFLLFRAFTVPQIYGTGTGGVNAGSAASSTSSELLSNRVSEFLNTYFGSLTGLKDLQLGLNYRPGTQASNDAVDLALSKQFFNNKITVDGNFGVNNTSQGNNSNSLIGDVNVDYKVSQDGRFRLKGFNRSNDNTQIITAGGPYTQGVGFFYRVEFETFNELWKRFLKKVDKKDKP